MCSLNSVAAPVSEPRGSRYSDNGPISSSLDPNSRAGLHRDLESSPEEESATELRRGGTKGLLGKSAIPTVEKPPVREATAGPTFRAGGRVLRLDGEPAALSEDPHLPSSVPCRPHSHQPPAHPAPAHLSCSPTSSLSGAPKLMSTHLPVQR